MYLVIFFFLAGAILGQPCYSSNPIIKCIDKDGRVAFINTGTCPDGYYFNEYQKTTIIKTTVESNVDKSALVVNNTHSYSQENKEPVTPTYQTNNNSPTATDNQYYNHNASVISSNQHLTSTDVKANTEGKRIISFGIGRYILWPIAFAICVAAWAFIKSLPKKAGDKLKVSAIKTTTKRIIAELHMQVMREFACTGQNYSERVFIKNLKKIYHANNLQDVPEKPSDVSDVYYWICNNVCAGVLNELSYDKTIGTQEDFVLIAEQINKNMYLFENLGEMININRAN